MHGAHEIRIYHKACKMEAIKAIVVSEIKFLPLVHDVSFASERGGTDQYKSFLRIAPQNVAHRRRHER